MCTLIHFCPVQKSTDFNFMLHRGSNVWTYFENLSGFKTLFLKKSRQLSLNIIKHIVKLPNSNQSIFSTDWLKPYQKVCIIMAAVIRSDSVVPWYTNPAPWQIFRFPWVAFFTAAHTAGVFPLREYGISFYLFAYLICKTPNVAV